MLKITVLVVLLTIFGETISRDYCKISEDHTMCKFQGPGKKCKPLIDSGMTSSQRRKVVDIHNKLRSRVAAGEEVKGSGGPQPPAANMRKMEWDNELAMIAQRWTDQCDYGHDACRMVERFFVGQNTYMKSGYTGFAPPDWKRAVHRWYNEVKEYNRNNVSVTTITGHYSQVVWAETYKLGCGYTKFRAGKRFHQFYACNYGPAGNRIDEDMYKIGTACSSCPTSNSTCEKNLCA